MNARVAELFHEVADLTPDKRSHYFAEHAVDEETRKEVEALVAADSGVSEFLLHDISLAASRALPLLDAKGWRCGPYRLLEVVGRGGMGAVYRAERADGEVTQQVAVKLLTPGAADPQRERFLQERQILAALAHPNIARMMDAGHLDNGQPFLAMEYVDGKPINVFATTLTVRQRITLFLKVCAAVAYLHRNLVVHRDLKPSNILVTADGEPKLLDFGIAKILDLTTDATVTSMRMLTPDYASPEQVTGGRVSTATDIYSLGAVLYRLLTGKPPHEFEERSPEAIALSITMREVTRPSKLAPGLRGDLESILLKAMRKDPQERYRTVEQFAEDLEAFLESRPVRARTGKAWYRTRKFLRRYWLPVTAATLVIASLAGGLFVANRERAIAQRRFDDVRQLANKLFDIDLLVRQLSGSTATRQLIVNTSLEYLGRLAADARDDPGLALELGNAYMWVARVQGVPIAANLGQIEEADKNLRLAEQFIQSVLKSQPVNRTALLRSAEIERDRMILADINGKDDEALTLARQADEGLKKFNAQESDQPEARAILGAYLNVAERFEHDHLPDDALRLSRRGSELARTFRRDIYVGNFLDTNARILQSQGALDEALRSIQESVALLEPRSGNVDHLQVVNFVMSLVLEGEILGGENQISFGRPEEAIAILQRAFKMIDDRVHQDPNDEDTRGILEMAGYPLASTLQQSDPRAALSIYDHTLGHLAEIKTNPNVQFYEARALAGSSYPLRALGRPAEARRRLDQAFQRLRQLKMYPDSEVPLGSGPHRALAALADYEAEIGDRRGSLQLYRELLDKTATSKPGPQIRLQDAMNQSSIYEGMAAVYRRTGDAESASALDARRSALWRYWERKLPNNPYVLRQIAVVP